MNTNELEEEIPEPDYDTRWKEIIEKFAPQFVQFHYPKSLWRQINHERGIKPMSDELQKIFPDFDKKGRLYPDKLLKMYLKTGEEHLVIVHTEVERSPSKDVGKRTYQCFVRLQERNPNAIITSLVIFIGKYIPEKCNVYTYNQFGTKFTFRYKVCKVKDLKEEKLLKSKNPIALVMLAAFYNIKTEGRKKLKERLHFKIKLAKLCFQRNYKKKEIEELLWFVEYTIALPPTKEKVYEKEFDLFLKRKVMPLIDEYSASSIRNMERAIYGRTLEERDQKRDREKNKINILSLLSMGLKPTQIAQGLRLDLEFVEDVILNHKKE